MDNTWLIVTDIIMIISNTYFVINKTGYWQLNFIASVFLTVAVSLMIAKKIFKKGRKK